MEIAASLGFLIWEALAIWLGRNYIKRMEMKSGCRGCGANKDLMLQAEDGTLECPDCWLRMQGRMEEVNRDAVARAENKRKLAEERKAKKRSK